jgi:hypothetical protein
MKPYQTCFKVLTHVFPVRSKDAGTAQDRDRWLALVNAVMNIRFL